MDKEKALKEIRSNISKGSTGPATEQIKELANCFSEDVFTLLTCASLLKAIEDEKNARNIAGIIPEKVKKEDGLEAAKGLRGLGYPAEAEKILSGIEESEETVRERMRALFDLRRFEESAILYDKLTGPTLSDSVVRAESLSANKEHDRAAAAAKEILAEAPEDLNVQRCYCAVLTAAGRSKEAEKFVKDNLKKNKASPDANALAAYQLWIEGKTKSAGVLASKAVQGDPGNTMAMETLAYCLIENGKLKEAKIVAGAINEKEPGNPAVARILNACRAAD
ncbi:MAG: tetratricopeptide repeat protein [Candidatus Methanoplasma sp.]|jgi:tetratricopeptide (TPR) repeat protein|nr:tetratricopeptide repeat protein [Candidatus Methanoplasma sp.]